MTDSTYPTDARAIIDLAVTSVGPITLDHADKPHAIVVPTGYTAQLVTPDELERPEHTLDAPRRIRQAVGLHDTASLVRYAKHHDEGTTTLYADADTCTVTALLDATAAGRPSWNGHRAVVKLRTTPEWKRWALRDRKLVGQLEFAEHIEDGLGQIVEPPAAVLLDVAQHFQAHRRVEFRSGRKLTSGETQFTYAETIDAKAGQTGNVVVPDEFFLGLSPFEGLDTAYKVRARLRYRLDDGALRIGYVLDNPDAVLREAFDECVAGVEADLGMAAWRGVAP